MGQTTVAPGTSITVTVSFLPQALGARSANLSIASNDRDENPFDIALTGARQEETSLEDYGKAYGLSGDSLLPDADDDGDGVSLLEEYAFNLDPTVADSRQANIRLVGGRLQAEYLRRTSDPNLTYQVEFGSSLAGGFQPTTETETVTPANPDNELDPMNLDFERVTVHDSETTATRSVRFGRVKVDYSKPE